MITCASRPEREAEEEDRPVIAAKSGVNTVGGVRGSGSFGLWRLASVDPNDGLAMEKGTTYAAIAALSPLLSTSSVLRSTKFHGDVL
ncbi:hypothetical protein M7I_2128 [Glarea lozoyensis 74030]|uniref:Uncharacterized protein n=1 Tax=Glarea lozoyensis (strain ATCC 74030 / MF5533) TaxID=1104152 RepID=H0EHY5_GLAL7|nr:hypothetical protein M7I_2128 [Glarea lozoyensis 74030]